MDNLGIFMVYHQEYYGFVQNWWAPNLLMDILIEKMMIRHEILSCLNFRQAKCEATDHWSLITQWGGHQGRDWWNTEKGAKVVRGVPSSSRLNLISWGFQLFKHGRKDWIISRFNDPFALLLMVYRYLVVDHFSILLVKMAALRTYWIYWLGLCSVYVYPPVN